MPKVISDELYEDLISNIHEGRLLGIMGKLERLRDGSIPVTKGDTVLDWNNQYVTLYIFKEDLEGETKTNNN